MRNFLLLLLLSLTALKAELTIPALTAYGVPDANAIRMNKTRGVVDWKDPAQKVVWYGEFKKAGEVTAAVSVKLPKAAVSKLKLTLGGKSSEVTVNGTDEPQVVKFGNFTLAKPGYAPIELSSLNAAGTSAGDILSLQLDGPATEGAHFNLLERRNAASVHMNYPTEGKPDVAVWYNEVTAVEDPVNTFYMACGFSRGYFGMQVNSKTERRIIFSVWDSGTGQDAKTRAEVPEENHTKMLAKGEGVVGEVFGHEGTGGHSHLVYNWKTGEAQKFAMTAKPEGTFTTYTGFWFHPEKKEWMLIASFRAPHDGKWIRGMHSFVENFSGATGNVQRKALFGPQWIKDSNGNWQELLKANFTHDGTGKSDRLDRFMGVEKGKFFLSNGGFVEGFTKYGEQFTRPATTAPQLTLPEVK